MPHHETDPANLWGQLRFLANVLEGESQAAVLDAADMINQQRHEVARLRDALTIAFQALAAIARSESGSKRPTRSWAVDKASKGMWGAQRTLAGHRTRVANNDKVILDSQWKPADEDALRARADAVGEELLQEDATPPNWVWQYPSAPPSDDNPHRRGIFTWDDNIGGWDLEMWLPGLHETVESVVKYLRDCATMRMEPSYDRVAELIVGGDEE